MQISPVRRRSSLYRPASQGRKLELLENNRNVCFEMDVDQELAFEEIPCKWGVQIQECCWIWQGFIY